MINTWQFLLLDGWSGNHLVLLLCAFVLAGYCMNFGLTRRIWYLAAALLVAVIALVSPINTLADGYLFSAHMTQHILLLLIVPPLALLSLPKTYEPPAVLRGVLQGGCGGPVVGWLAGVGAMWFWHAPALCNAAASFAPVRAIQTVSLLALGALFWRQVLAVPGCARLQPLQAVIYLFTACTACSILGIILTFSPVTICKAYMAPADPLGIEDMIRGRWGMTMEKDQQIGGLLMWVPMCLIYLAAIFGQLARWYGAREEHVAPGPDSGRTG